MIVLRTGSAFCNVTSTVPCCAIGGVCVSAVAIDTGLGGLNAHAAEDIIEDGATQTPAEPAPFTPPVIAEEATPAQPDPIGPPACNEQNAGPPPAEPSPFMPPIFTEETAGTNFTDPHLVTPMDTPLVSAEDDTTVPAAAPGHMAPTDPEDNPGAAIHPINPPADAEEDADAPTAAPLPSSTPFHPSTITEQGARPHPSTTPAAAPEREGATPIDTDGDMRSSIKRSSLTMPLPLPLPPVTTVQERPATAASINGDDAFAEWMSSGKHALPCLRVPITVQVCLIL